MDLLLGALGALGALGFCRPDGTFVTTLDELGERLGEMAASGRSPMGRGVGRRTEHRARRQNVRLWRASDTSISIVQFADNVINPRHSPVLRPRFSALWCLLLPPANSLVPGRPDGRRGPRCPHLITWYR